MWRSRPLAKFIATANVIYGRQRRFSAMIPYAVRTGLCKATPWVITIFGGAILAYPLEAVIVGQYNDMI